MDRKDGYDPPRRGLRILGWACLIAGLPVACFAALAPPNEYRATLGISALDCDGPFEVYLLALPALLIYGIGLVVNGMRWRRPWCALAALFCFAICTAVVSNVTRAAVEESRQAAACG